MAGATLRRAARVTRGRDFDRARKGGRVLGDAVLRIVCIDNGLDRTRLGLAVPRRGTNVARNRIKRAIREAFRRRRADLPAGLDLVVSPRDQARASDCAEVMRSFDGLVLRLSAKGIK